MKCNNQITNRNQRSYYDPFFQDFFDFAIPGESKFLKNSMKTDIVETDSGYEFSIELAGYRKEDVSLDLDNGYLTITATKDEVQNDEKKFIRRERVIKSCKRSFYLGDNVVSEDIKAKMDNGILFINIPKKTDEAKSLKRIEIK